MFSFGCLPDHFTPSLHCLRINKISNGSFNFIKEIKLKIRSHRSDFMGHISFPNPLLNKFVTALKMSQKLSWVFQLCPHYCRGRECLPLTCWLWSFPYSTWRPVYHSFSTSWPHSLLAFLIRASTQPDNLSLTCLAPLIPLTKQFCLRCETALLFLEIQD